MNDTWGHIDRRPAFGLEDSLRRRGDSRTTGFQPGDDNGQDARRSESGKMPNSDISQICADFSGETSSHQGHKGHKDVGAAVSAAKNSQRNLETRNQKFASIPDSFVAPGFQICLPRLLPACLSF